jgi:hypothetical protein
VGGGRGGGLDADHGGAGGDGGGDQACRGGAGPASDGDDEDVEARGLLEELEVEGADAGDDAWFVGRADEAGARALGEGGGLGAGVVEVGAVQQHVGALVEDCPELDRVGVVGHDDGAGGAGEAGGVGDALGVVAGGVGDDAAGAFGVGHGEQEVAGAAGLEGSGALLVLVLDDYRGVGGAVELRVLAHGGADDGALQAGLRGEDVGDGRQCRCREPGREGRERHGSSVTPA